MNPDDHDIPPHRRDVRQTRIQREASAEGDLFHPADPEPLKRPAMDSLDPSNAPRVRKALEEDTPFPTPLYLWLCCEGWMRFGPFKWLRIDHEAGLIIGPDGIVATGEKGYWQVTGNRGKGMSFSKPTVSAARTLPDELPGGRAPLAQGAQDLGPDPAEQLRQILKALGVEDLPFEAAEQFFRNQTNVGMANYQRPDEVFSFDVGLPNDHEKCLHLLNAVVAPFEHSYSCGLARTVSLPDLKAVEEFFRRLGLAHAAGNLAWAILHHRRIEARSAGRAGDDPGHPH